MSPSMNRICRSDFHAERAKTARNRTVLYGSKNKPYILKALKNKENVRMYELYGDF